MVVAKLCRNLLEYPRTTAALHLDSPRRSHRTQLPVCSYSLQFMAESRLSSEFTVMALRDLTFDVSVSDLTAEIEEVTT